MGIWKQHMKWFATVFTPPFYSPIWNNVVDIEFGDTDSSLTVGGAGGECDSSSSFLMMIMSVLDLARDL